MTITKSLHRRGPNVGDGRDRPSRFAPCVCPSVWHIWLNRPEGRIDARAFPDNGKPTLKGIQLAIDELVKDIPKAKNVTPRQVIDLSFLP